MRAVWFDDLVFRAVWFGDEDSLVWGLGQFGLVLRADWWFGDDGQFGLAIRADGLVLRAACFDGLV